MKIKKYPKIYRLGLRYPSWVLIGAVLCALVASYFAKKLVIQTDFSSLLPAKSEAVRNYRELSESFGSLSFLYATVEAPDQASRKNFATEFARALEALPSIRYVEVDWPVEFFKKRKWFFLEMQDLVQMERRVDRALELAKDGVSPTFSPLMAFADDEDKPDLTFKDIKKKYEEKFGQNFSGRNTSQDEDFILLRIRPAEGSASVEANQALMTRVKEVEAQLKLQKSLQSVKVGYAGDYPESIEILKMVRSEIFWISSIVFIVLNLILVLYFRRLSGAVLVGVPLAIGILWSGGLIYPFLGHLNLVTGFAVSILAGLGSDYGIFLLSRYFHERDDGKSHEEACELAFSKTGRATWISVIVTMGAFVALMISGFKVFYEFGLVGALGVVLNYLVMMLLIPSLLQLGERYKNYRWARLISWFPKPPHAAISGFIGRLFRPSAPVWVVGVAVVLCLLSAWTLPKQNEIIFEDGQFDTEKSSTNQVHRKISEKIDESLAPTALLVRGSEQERRTVRGLNRLLEEKPPGELVFNKVIGVSSFIPEDQDGKRAVLARLLEKYQKHPMLLDVQKEKFAASIEATLALPNITLDNLPIEVKRNFVSPHSDQTFLVALYPSIPREVSENMKKYQAGLVSAREEIGVPFKPVDGALLGASVTDLISGEAGFGLGLLLVFFAGVLFFATQNFKTSLLILLHLLWSLIVLSGVLYLLGIRLNILNIAVLPIIVGTVVDCFIHFAERYHDEGDLSLTVHNEVPPVLTSTLTSIVGFGGFVFTSSWGLQSLGWVAVIGLTLVLISCTLIFPRTLLLLSRPSSKIIPAGESLAEV